MEQNIDSPGDYVASMLESYYSESPDDAISNIDVLSQEQEPPENRKRDLEYLADIIMKRLKPSGPQVRRIILN